MNKYIQEFIDHIKGAVEIGSKLPEVTNTREIHNICIMGLGGSGISGTIVSELYQQEFKVPVQVNKDYFIPKFVSENTLFVACSYSGNTEETLIAVEEARSRNAQIVAVTSGGALLDLVKENNYYHAVMPGGYPPRAAFGYAFSLVQMVLEKHNVIGGNVIGKLNGAIDLLTAEEQNIKDSAKALASMVEGTMPILYATAGYEGVAVRIRQQLNENAKMLCSHHVIPEMNHNELVGWRDKNEKLSVIFFTHENEFVRTKKRIELNQEIISKYTSNVNEVMSKGSNKLERTFYLILFGDWLSYYLSDLRKMDSIEVDVIMYLKGELAKI